MKTLKKNPRQKTKTKTVFLPKIFNIYRKYRNHKKYVHSELL